MINSILRRVAPLALILLFFGSCSRNRFSVEGEISGADGRTVVLERQDAAGWLPIDSARLGADGSFSFGGEAPANPELLRLALDGRYIYLPVDSTDNLLVRSSLKGFDSAFTLSGTPQAEKLTAFEREARRVEALQNADSTEAFRRRVYNFYLKDSRGSILSYYILNKQLGGEWLIDYTSPLYNAVATAFQTYRPDDPHTALLVARAAQGQAERRKNAGKGVKMQATQTGVVPISLPGADGKNRALSSLLGRGKPVVVAFVSLTRDDAAGINMELRKLWDAGRCDIYEVCIDPDQFAWRQAARNLPWTVVFDPEGEYSTAARNYNVASLPAFFIYNTAGDLVQSTGAPEKVGALL